MFSHLMRTVSGQHRSYRIGYEHYQNSTCVGKTKTKNFYKTDSVRFYYEARYFIERRLKFSPGAQ